MNIDKQNYARYILWTIVFIVLSVTYFSIRKTKETINDIQNKIPDTIATTVPFYPNSSGKD